MVSDKKKTKVGIRAGKWLRSRDANVAPLPEKILLMMLSPQDIRICAFDRRRSHQDGPSGAVEVFDLAGDGFSFGIVVREDPMGNPDANARPMRGDR